MARPVSPRGFNVQSLFEALDAQRALEGMSWAAAARSIWDESADLNAKRRDHPISTSTITGMPRRGDISCQHALFFLRWLDRAPEDFIAEPRPGTTGIPLPRTDPAHRLRWDLLELYNALNAARIDRGANWALAADRLHCSPNQLTGLRTAKFATSMRLAMRICQALRRPAADFVYVSNW
jgi:hypothetical protein